MGKSKYFSFKCLVVWMFTKRKPKKVGEHRSERNEITSSQLTDTGELIKIITAYCDKFLGNTLRNLIWINIDHTLYNVVRRAIATRFDLAQAVSVSCDDVISLRSLRCFPIFLNLYALR